MESDSLFLEGTWKGKGKLIDKTLEYGEELEIKKGKGNTYFITQKTKHPEKGPLHAESGFIRYFGKEGKIEMVISHPFGVCEITEGTVTSNEIVVKSTSITRTSSAKEPFVTSFTRKYYLKEDGSLYYQMYLGTTKNKEEYFHLEGTLTKEK